MTHPENFRSRLCVETMAGSSSAFHACRRWAPIHFCVRPSNVTRVKIVWRGQIALHQCAKPQACNGIEQGAFHFNPQHIKRQVFQQCAGLLVLGAHEAGNCSSAERPALAALAYCFQQSAKPIRAHKLSRSSRNERHPVVRADRGLVEDTNKEFSSACVNDRYCPVGVRAGLFHHCLKQIYALDRLSKCLCPSQRSSQPHAYSCEGSRAVRNRVQIDIAEFSISLGEGTLRQAEQRYGITGGRLSVQCDRKTLIRFVNGDSAVFACRVDCQNSHSRSLYPQRGCPKGLFR